MRDDTLERMTRLAIESMRLASPTVGGVDQAGCPSRERVRAIGQRQARATATEQSHLSRCRACAIRLAAESVESSRFVAPRLRVLRGLTVFAAAAAVLIAVAPHSHPVVDPGHREFSAHPAPVTEFAQVLPGIDFARLVMDCIRCDANCDGTVTHTDISAFLLALSSPDNYADEYPDCDVLCSVDLNCDGTLDDDDIAPLVTSVLSEG